MAGCGIRQVNGHSCTTLRRRSLCGSDLFTTQFLHSTAISFLSDVMRGARSRAITLFIQPVMAYKEAKPQTFVRIRVPWPVRVM